MHREGNKIYDRNYSSLQFMAAVLADVNKHRSFDIWWRFTWGRPSGLHPAPGHVTLPSLVTWQRGVARRQSHSRWSVAS